MPEFDHCLREVFTQRGEAQRTSWIDLEPMRMPPLSYGEVVQEIKRLELPLMTRERSALIEMVSEYEKPHRLSYKLLKYIETKLLNRENAELVFEKRMKIWRKQFQNAEGKQFLSKKGGLIVRKAIGVWSEITGISSLKGLVAALATPLKSVTDILGNFAQKGGKNDKK
ncbi:MAG: hypothetical protein GY801_52185 [bacterium]|nr:hypothetical protein [bacterium]